MKVFADNEYLNVYLEGRISSDNVASVENEIQSALNEHKGLKLSFDAENLQYISSAGLRMLLRFQKESGSPITIKNVSPEVYEIFDVTGFTTLMNVKRKMREVSVDGCEVIGTGAFGKVYRLDEDTVVKLYSNAELIPMIENEQKRSRQAFVKGIPTAIPFDIVKVGENFGSVFEMVKAQNSNDIIAKEPDRLQDMVKKYAQFLKTLHSIEVEPGELPDTRKVYENYLDAMRNDIPENIYKRLQELLQAMPEDLHVVHGDVHLKNVMLSDNNMMLIDMETLSVGNPVFDFAGLFMTYEAFNEDDPDNPKNFLGLSKKACYEIYHETLKYYLGEPDEAILHQAEEKISVVGYLRFLYVAVILRVSREDLIPIRLKHTIEHLQTLLEHVDSLAL